MLSVNRALAAIARRDPHIKPYLSEVRLHLERYQSARDRLCPRDTALSDIAKGADMEPRFREGIVRLSSFLVGHASTAPDVPFEKEERRAKGKRPAATDMPCPLCGKGKIAENSKSFYCTEYRGGCKFTIWKDALVRSGGPEMTAKLLRLCHEQKTVRGSTGVIYYENGSVRFVRAQP